MAKNTLDILSHKSGTVLPKPLLYGSVLSLTCPKQNSRKSFSTRTALYSSFSIKRTYTSNFFRTTTSCLENFAFNGVSSNFSCFVLVIYFKSKLALMISSWKQSSWWRNEKVAVFAIHTFQHS